MSEHLKDLTPEVYGIYAMYGRAFENEVPTSPQYNSKDIENFLGYNVNAALEKLREENVLKVENSEHIDEEVYKMESEEHKTSALLTWRILRDDFEGSFEKMRLNFEEAKQSLEDKNIHYSP